MDIKNNKERSEYYRASGWWTDKTLLDYWENTVNLYGEREYVVDNLGRRYTYAELDAKANALAGWMQKQGIKAKDVISMQCTPRSEFIIVVIACFKLGAVVVPMKMRTGAAEWIFLMKQIQSRMHFGMACYHGENMTCFIRKNEAELTDTIINIYIDGEGTADNEYGFEEVISGPSEPVSRPEVTADDIAVILFTSGTTNGSRGVMLSHNNIISSERIFNEMLHLTCEDSIFMPAPLSHATGFHHGIVSAMMNGGKIVLLDKYEKRTAMEIMDKEKCTFSMGATPFIYDYLRLMDEGMKKPEALKFYVCGGAPLPYELTRHAWNAHQLMVCECYGSTESVPHILVPPEKAVQMKGRWSGIVPDGIEVRIVDENNQDVQPGEVGEEISRGPNVFLGYLGKPEETDKVLDDEGWCHSGDLCYSDGKGRIKICGRKKDIIVRGGENLNILEIEESLRGCPGIRQAAVVGMEDPRLGERVCAFVVLEDKMQIVLKEEITRYMKEKRVSKWLWPEHVEYIDEIPYTESGKIMRYQLKEELKKRQEAKLHGRQRRQKQVWAS